MPSISPADVRAREAVDDTSRLVREVRTQLSDLIARTSRVVDDADWRAPSAGGFHDRVDELRGRLVTAQVRADLALDALTRVRVELEAREWAPLP